MIQMSTTLILPGKIDNDTRKVATEQVHLHEPYHLNPVDLIYKENITKKEDAPRLQEEYKTILDQN